MYRPNVLRHKWLLACAFLAAACNIDPYRLDFGGDGGNGLQPDARRDAGQGGGGKDSGGGGGDGGTTGCVPAAERCDGLDNDCDGVIDNGFDKNNDPANCGACGHACNEAQPNQRGRCVGGQCVYECAPGFLDCKPEVAGCEYACIKTNGGVEACDGLDNDCNCQIDEGFNTKTDVNNCGACGHVCVALHATSTCVNGQCGVGACDPGYQDHDPNVNGCEYRCPVWPPKSNDATCDGIDDDCDGQIDEDVPGVGTPCTTDGKGECAAGTNRCVNGHPTCTPDHVPTPEACDGKDNDCDGRIDNGYDKNNDPNHCGPDCKVCSFPHGIAGCSAGKCVLLGCDPGYSDADPTKPGCELQCTPSGPEVCDGIDNDCDGKIDEDDPDLVRPSASFCASRGACAAVTLSCSKPPQGCGDQTIHWRCVYPAGAETDSCGDLLPQETLCDGLDGDCDGAVDDAFPLVGKACDDGKLGICKSTGTYICDPADPAKKSVKCNLTSPGQPKTTEVCNGEDDDCDGVVDNGAKDDLVHVKDATHDFWIYTYEASHPDASASSAGSSTDRSCSQADVLPWALVTWTEAAAACADAGKRLCSEDEWQTACMGASKTTYPYGNSYAATRCNGNDYDPIPGGIDDDLAVPTGSLVGCASPWANNTKIFDMSGNLREWTSTPVSGFRRIRGGGYDNVAAALKCTFDFWAEDEDQFYFNLGFRCCADKAD
jgi:sulfatase-modifying factor enzyme 1/putative metal-binding protein